MIHEIVQHARLKFRVLTLTLKHPNTQTLFLIRFGLLAFVGGYERKTAAGSSDGLRGRPPLDFGVHIRNHLLCFNWLRCVLDL